MKKLFISYNIPSKISSMLSGMGFSVLPLPSSPQLPDPVSSHADMLIFSDKSNIVLSKDYYNANKELFAEIKPIISDVPFSKKYPGDVIFNAFAIDDTLYARLDSISKDISAIYPKRINVRQGYAKCSVLILPNKSAITADMSIYKVLTANGRNVLKISPGGIALPGYDCGFIGGASCVTGDTVIFFGNIYDHPDSERILEFINSNKAKALFVQDYPLTDFGGAVIL